MSLQIIQNEKGKPTGVFIPISEWNKMKEKYKNLEELEETFKTKAEILENIRQGVEEVKQVIAGKIKGKSLQDLLNEL